MAVHYRSGANLIGIGLESFPSAAHNVRDCGSEHKKKRKYSTAEVHPCFSEALRSLLISGALYHPLKTIFEKSGRAAQRKILWPIGKKRKKKKARENEALQRYWVKGSRKSEKYIFAKKYCYDLYRCRRREGAGRTARGITKRAGDGENK